MIAVVATCSLIIGAVKMVPVSSWNSYLVAPDDGVQEKDGFVPILVAPFIGEPMEGTIASEGAMVKLLVSENAPLNGVAVLTFQ